MQHMPPSRRVTVTAEMNAACWDRVVNHGNDRRTRNSELLMSNRDNGQPLARRPANAWLRRLHPDQRTGAAEHLASRIRSFQHSLRLAAAEQGADALTGPLLPYALRFAVIGGDQDPLARFVHRWVETFGELPGWHRPGAEPHNRWRSQSQ
jgi:hypothetical protein